MLWNTVAVRDAHEPNDWADLLDPRWQRPRRHLDGAGRVRPPGACVWGEARVLDFVRPLHREGRPVLTDSTFKLAAMVGSGELAVAFGIHHTALPAIRRGAPIGVRFLDPTPANTIYTFVPRQAGNPAGGTLLAAWLTTPEGAAAYEAATGRGNPLLAGSQIGALLGPRRLTEYPLPETAAYQAVSEKLNAALKARGVTAPPIG